MAKAIETKKASEKKASTEKKAAGEKKAAAPKLPFGKKMGTLTLKLRQRFEKALKKVSASDKAEVAELKALAGNVTQALDAMTTKFNALPEAFALTGAKGEGGGKVEVGQKVAVREKRKAEYEGLLEETEMASLEVVAIKGAKVVLKTEGGNKLFMPKSHVAPVKAAPVVEEKAQAAA